MRPDRDVLGKMKTHETSVSMTAGSVQVLENPDDPRQRWGTQ